MTRSRSMCRLLCSGALIALLAPSLAAQESGSVLDQVPWVEGPLYGGLGKVAEVEVPASCRFTDKKGAKLFMNATENPVDGSELGVLLCREATADSAWWFVVFSYDESGLVRDDEKMSLDQAAILKTLQRGTEAGNEERKSRGWDQLEIVGWERAPYYDPATHNLTWSTRVRVKGSTDDGINHSVRLLGRGGVMHADLVADPAHLASAVATFDSIIAKYTYVSGHQYAEWREGDKLAGYGLTALVAGGAGVAAAKLGLFGKAWKLVLGVLIAAKKLVLVVLIGIGALLKRLFSKKEQSVPATGSPS